MVSRGHLMSPDSNQPFISIHTCKEHSITQNNDMGFQLPSLPESITDPAVKDFLEKYYEVSNTGHAHDDYTDLFTKGKSHFRSNFFPFWTVSEF